MHVHPQENCYFFCSVIYENLVAKGGGVNVVGVPSKLSMSLAPEVRAKIRSRSQTYVLISIVFIILSTSFMVFYTASRRNPEDFS